MRLVIRVFFAIVVLILVVVGGVAVLVPQDAVRDQAIALVKQHTGRTLAVRGKTAFAFYPSLGVELGDVTLSGPLGMQGGPMLRMASLTLNVRLLPLLTRNVVINEFVMQRPVIELRVDAQGRRSWDFAAGRPEQRLNEQPPRAAAPAAPGVPAQTTAVRRAMVDNVRIGSVRIVGGVVLYRNDRSGVRHRLDAVNVSLEQDRASGPLQAQGEVVWQGEKVTFKGNVGSITALIRGGPSAVTLNAASRHGEGDFSGRLVTGAAVAAEGELSISTPSLRALAQWTGKPLPPGNGLGPVSVSSRIKYQDKNLAFTKASFSLDGMKGQGNGSLAFKDPRPYLRAAFAVDRLDLNTWLAPAEAAPAPAPGNAPSPQAPPTGQPPNAKPKPDSLTDFIEKLNSKQPAPKVQAWNRRAINFAALNAMDADVNVNMGALLYHKIQVGQSALSASLKGGVLTANLSRLELYDGTGTGRITLNGARELPALAVALDLKSVSALPLLDDAAAFAWVSGRANLAVNLSGAGRTQDEIVRTLQGNGSFAFTDGALEGFNIPAMVRGLKQGDLSAWKRQERLKTDFSSLTGTFTMQNGLASNSDLNLIGPLIRMTGKGTVDAPAEQVDFAIEPRLVASLQGQGAAGDLEGLVIPVRVHGPWSDPKITPELDKVDPDAALDAARKAFDKLKGQKITGKDVENLLKSVLGENKPAEPGEQPVEGDKTKAKDLLKQFLGR